MALVAVSCVVYTLMFFYFSRENKRRERGDYDHKIEGMSEDEIVALGDENPRFRFAR
jgi:hypothetical protein